MPSIGNWDGGFFCGMYNYTLIVFLLVSLLHTTCRRLVAMAISPQVMSAPYSLQILRNGKLPTFNGGGEGDRDNTCLIHTVVSGAR